MVRKAVNYECESINLYTPRATGESIKIDGFTFQRFPLMNNDLDCGYRVFHGEKLIDVYQHYQKQSVTYDIHFKTFEYYMKWARKQVKNQAFLYY